MDRLDLLREEIQRDPRRALDGTTAIVSAARAEGDLRLLSRALGVRGRARRALGDIAPAEADLVGSVAAGAASDDDELVADASIGLAGVLMFAGRTDEAFEHLRTADRLGSDRLRACAAVQRATVAFKVGHIPAALAAYELALPTLRRLDMRVELSVTLLNRGVIRAQAGDFDDAMADLTEAGELFAGSGQRYGAAQVCHGIGWAHARHGDLVQALEHLDRAADLFRELGHDALEVDVDRVEVLLAAGLTSAAAELGAETARRAAAAGDHMHEAQMWLMCARSAFVEGNRRTGAACAERARVLFTAQRSVVWQHLSALEVIRAGLAAPEVDELCALAAALDRSGHARGAVTATGLAALAAVTAGDLERAEDLAGTCAERSRRLGVFEVRVLAQLAGATCSLARGDQAGARSQVRAGLGDLRRHRSTLAAADAIASVAIHAEELAALGLRLALADGRPEEVLASIELVRTGRRRSTPARPLADEAAEAELAELRSVVAELRRQEAAGGDTVDLLHQQRDLERVVHRRSLRTAGRGGGAAAREGDPPPVDLGTLRATLDDRQLVELAAVDDRLIGVVVDAQGARVTDIAPYGDVLALTGTMASALRTAVAPGRSAAAAGARNLLLRVTARLDETLGAALGGEGPIVLVVPPALNAVPWRLLAALADRAVMVAPSATWWCEAAGAATPRGPTVAIAGPRLVEASAEARAVASCYVGATLLDGSAATTTAAVDAFATAGTVHVASHGHVRRDNPLWSSLELADGPLCVYDLEPLPRTPGVVVLSGCETAVGVPAGHGLLGLANGFLERGTQSLVASVCPLPDTPQTRSAMTALHQRLAAGVPPSAALAELGSRPWATPAAMLAATLTCFGTR